MTSSHHSHEPNTKPDEATESQSTQAGSEPSSRQENDPEELRFNTIPNHLTLFRIVIVPLVVGLLFFRHPTWDLIAAILFALASITDFFDGFLARRQESTSIYGKLMDPLADKFLVVSSLIMLQYLERIHPIIIILLICRELGITGLRALASSEGIVIWASPSAKLKTIFQMVAIPFIMVKEPLFQIPMYWTGKALLYLSLLMSLWSAKDYIRDFFKNLSQRRLARLRKKRKKLSAKKTPGD